MKKYLKDVEIMDNNEQRDALRNMMQIRHGCLIQAIDYLHEMRIKHNDLKPENVLIKEDKILVANFGISKDLIHEEITTTLNMGPRGTLMYWAPEVGADNRHSRVADIFSIVLEIATALVGPRGSSEL